MAKRFLYALIVGAIAIVVWQSDSVRTMSAEVHTGDRHNCELVDFANQRDAQAHYRENPTDPDDLDHDNDRIACNGTDLPCPCDFTPVPVPATDPTPTPTPRPDAGRDPGTASSASGPLCHDNCIPDTYWLEGLNPSPGFNRPVVMTFIAEKTTIGCGDPLSLHVRVLYPDGVGAPNRLVTFQSSLGTVRDNLLSDYTGYVQTKFVAPLSPAIVQVDARADGLRQSVQIKVDCQQPVQAPPVPVAPAPVFSPPKTGEAGLADSRN